MDRCKFVYETKYGKTTDIFMLPVGTKFSVTNGIWDGEIIEENGKKFLLVIESGSKIELKDNYDYSLVINIKT